MKKVFLLLAFCTSAHAGVVSLTHHSRANCVNNESISWHAGHEYKMAVTSWHHGFALKDGQEPVFVSHGICSNGTQNIDPCKFHTTWRGAAVHWAESMPGNGSNWRVIGTHVVVLQNGKVEQVTTNVTDCSIYDGWWD